MIDHPAVRAQAPRIILVTPPPINEYACETNDRSKGITQPRRKAGHTRLYADAVRDLAAQRGLACLDLWTIFSKHAGWSGETDDDSPLPGSRQIPENAFMRMLLHDGNSMPQESFFSIKLIVGRIAFHKRGIYSILSRTHEVDIDSFSRSDAREITFCASGLGQRGCMVHQGVNRAHY